jgi:GMP synthase PP-ATPase subunit
MTSSTQSTVGDLVEGLSSELGVPSGLPGRLDVPTGELAAQFLSGFGPQARAVVAMSGGVDSSVAAHLLHGAGHSLVGLFMRNGVHVDAAESQKKSCCSVSDARDARMVAA